MKTIMTALAVAISTLLTAVAVAGIMFILWASVADASQEKFPLNKSHEMVGLSAPTSFMRFNWGNETNSTRIECTAKIPKNITPIKDHCPLSSGECKNQDKKVVTQWKYSECFY